MLVGFGALAVMLGLIVALLEPRWLFAGVLGATAVCLVFYDYRVGVICLTMLLPWSWSPIVPQTHGFNLVNFLILASVMSLAMRRSFSAEPTVLLPKVVGWCYLLPIAIAVLVAWPHLSEGAANFRPKLPDLEQIFAPDQFLKTRIIKPLFFVIYAFLVANAVRDSKKPEGLLVVFGLSAILPAIAIMIDFVVGGPTADPMNRGGFLVGLGLHPNEYGMQLALAAGPLLFLCVGAGSKLTRIASGAAFALVSVGLLLTASRGAAVAYLVILGVWLLRRRKAIDLALGLALVVVLFVALPDSVWTRLGMGLDDTRLTTTHNMDDPLTKGRIASWAILAPDVLKSPVWGQGIGSTAWSVAVTAGRYRATHPHNLYLEILLDLGVLGFAAVLYLYYRYARTFRRLTAEPSLSPVLRDYFRGAYASFFGMLAMAIAGGHYMPHPEQAFLWLALGFAYSYWQLAQESGRPATRKPFGVGVRRAPLPPASSTQQH
jgi:O-antigen ligase